MSEEVTATEATELAARAEGPDQQEEPDYRELYEKARAESRKWEGRSKANAQKARAYDETEAKARTVEERLAALEGENAALRAERDRASLVSRVSAATGVDAAIVASLSGADEDALTGQAQAISSAIGGAPRYPVVHDAGAHAPAGGMTDEDVSKIKSPAERVRARAELIHQTKRK